MSIGILITGKAGVGKSTVAKMFFEELSFGFPVIISFAASIKEIAKEHFGWDGKKDKKGRRLLQVLGTEAGREYNENIWVDKAIQRFKDSMCTIMIVDDVRFDSEIIGLREYLDYIYVINIKGPQRAELNNMSHISECGIDPDYWVLEIYNGGTLENLRESVKTICNIEGL